MFQVRPHFILYALPNFILFYGPVCPGLLAFLQLQPFGTGGTHWSYMLEVNTSILGEFPKFAQLCAMGKSKRLIQINKNHTKYGILVSLAKEKAQPSTHMVILLQKHPHIVSVMVYHHRLVMVVDHYTELVTMCQ
jgi:hypothetical protein